jgi:hypothetical protein
VAEEPGDRLGVEAAQGEEAVLAGALGEIDGRRAVLLAPDGERAVALARAQLAQRGVDRFGFQPVPGEFLPDPPGAVARRTALDQALDEALVGKVARALEIVDERAQLLGGLGVTRELALEFRATVFAQREQPQCAAPQPRGVVGFPVAGEAQAASSADAPPRGATP